MNWRRMLYTGLVNILIGVGIGYVLANIAKSPYTSRAYQNLDRIYMTVGGVGGFLVGGSWEGLRQLKEKRDREERQLSQQSKPKDS